MTRAIRWLLYLLLVASSTLVVFMSWLTTRDNIMAATGFGTRLAVPGWDWWVMAGVQTVSVLVVGILLVRFRYYGVMVAIILLLLALAVRLGV